MSSTSRGGGRRSAEAGTAMPRGRGEAADADARRSLASSARRLARLYNTPAAKPAPTPLWPPPHLPQTSRAGISASSLLRGSEDDDRYGPTRAIEEGENLPAARNLLEIGGTRRPMIGSPIAVALVDVCALCLIRTILLELCPLRGPHPRNEVPSPSDAPRNRTSLMATWHRGFFLIIPLRVTTYPKN